MEIYLCIMHLLLLHALHQSVRSSPSSVRRRSHDHRRFIDAAALHALRPAYIAIHTPHIYAHIFMRPTCREHPRRLMCTWLYLYEPTHTPYAHSHIIVAPESLITIVTSWQHTVFMQIRCGGRVPHTKHPSSPICFRRVFT